MRTPPADVGAAGDGGGAFPRERSGFLVIDKPGGVTSREVVNRVVRLVGRRTAAGHAGTLDPLATGVLVVALGSATRLIEYVQRSSKTYEATVRLGARSDTDDADGTVVPAVTAAGARPERAAIEQALRSQQGGWVEQRPPRVSALKRQGQRAYDLARRGEAFELAPRRVWIERIRVDRYEWPELDLTVDCGAGTYIRSIARDLGEALGCGGLIAALRRTRIGRFSVDSALELESLSRESIESGLEPSAVAVADWPRLELSAEELVRVARGQALRRSDPADPPAGPVALFAADGSLAAVADREEGADALVRPRKVFVREERSSG